MHKPYKSVNDVNFDSAENQVENAFGAPGRTRVNRIGYKELDYGNSIYRFDGEGKLKEITLNASDVHLSDAKVAFIDLKEFILNQDSEAFEAVGFQVSPKYGLAFDTEFPSWVTFFARSELQSWKKYNT